jgi:hypothetical protein
MKKTFRQLCEESKYYKIAVGDLWSAPYPTAEQRKDTDTRSSLFHKYSVGP